MLHGIASPEKHVALFVLVFLFSLISRTHKTLGDLFCSGYLIGLQDCSETCYDVRFGDSGTAGVDRDEDAEVFNRSDRDGQD